MKVRLASCFSAATLLLVHSAIADELPAPVGADDKTISEYGFDMPAAETIVQLAAVTEETAQIAAMTTVAAPDNEQPPAPMGTANRPQLVAPKASPLAASDSGLTIKAVRQALAAHRDQLALAYTGLLKDPHDKLTVNAVKQEFAARRQEFAANAGAIRVVGRSENGTACWYGGRYVGRRTSSGEVLDTVHATAAHRTLPLNSLARVTNLANGLSVVVRVTDRGPLNKSLLIDMSPRAAEELQMKQSGLVPVKVEQVVELPPDAR